MQVQSVSKLMRRYENPFPPDSLRNILASLSGGLSAEELNERAAGLQNWFGELLNRSKVEAWGPATQAALSDFVKAPNQTAEELANAAAMYQRAQPWLRASTTSLSSLGEVQPSPPLEGSPQGAASHDPMSPAVERLSVFRSIALRMSKAERSLTPPNSADDGAMMAFEGRFYWRPSRHVLTHFFANNNSDWRLASWQVAWLSSSKEEAVLLRFDDDSRESTIQMNSEAASFSGDGGGGGGFVTRDESLWMASMVLPLKSVRLVEEVRGSRVEDQEEDDGMDLSVSMRSMATTLDTPGSSGLDESTHGAEDTINSRSSISRLQNLSVSGCVASTSKPSLFEFVLTLMDGKQVFMAATDAKEREEIILFLQSTLLRMAHYGRHDDVDLIHSVYQDRHQWKPPQALS